MEVAVTATAPLKDMSLKEGEKIKINIGGGAVSFLSPIVVDASHILRVLKGYSP